MIAEFYDTYEVAIGCGSICLIAYYSTKLLMPRSRLYQYVLSGVYGVFMAQYIYQMHGLFEMHFTAFISSAMLITYQNWRLQLPLVGVVVIHHAVFGYMQYIGYSDVYFTQLDYMDLQTFIIHVVLAAVIFFICGLWAHHFKKYSERHIKQTFEMGRLQHAEEENRELIKSNMELDKFVYSVSHDLRAPLTSMMGVIEIVEEDTADESVKEHTSMLKDGIKKLDKFILDILDYSRNSRMDIKKEKVNFSELLSDITNNLKFMCGRDKIKINIHAENEIDFYSDKSRLYVVLNNLISNAIRYHNPVAEPPMVDIDVITSEMEAAIVVKDNGIGIRKDQQEKVFDMFYRISEKSEGSGLGLYIVKETVSKLEGNISIDSEEGVGTSFKIKIPNTTTCS